MTKLEDLRSVTDSKARKVEGEIVPSNEFTGLETPQEINNIIAAHRGTHEFNPFF